MGYDLFRLEVVLEADEAAAARSSTPLGGP